MNTLTPAKEKYLQKGKESKTLEKVESLDGVQLVMIIGSQQDALKAQGHNCPKYHPRRQPGRCAICGSTRHSTSQSSEDQGQECRVGRLYLVL